MEPNLSDAAVSAIVDISGGNEDAIEFMVDTLTEVYDVDVDGAEELASNLGINNNSSREELKILLTLLLAAQLGVIPNDRLRGAFSQYEKEMYSLLVCEKMVNFIPTAE